MIDFIQIQTTFPDEPSAQACAAAMVGRRLAACAQVVGPITSHYFWQDGQERGTEWICLLKTRKMLFDLVSASIRDLHPYECPQIIGVPICEASVPYKNWLIEQTHHCRF